MSVTVVIGGQAGSEGKGKIAGYLALKDNVYASACNFYSNARHTWVSNSEEKVVVQQIPQACINPNTKLFICANAGISLDILLKEIQNNNCKNRLFIHPNAMIILPKHLQKEESLNYISSTKKGCGTALSDKILRVKNIVLAKDIPELKDYICETEIILNDMIKLGHNIMIEGSQGFDLDINYGFQYPYVTSRQTHAGQIIADCCIPVFLVTDVIAVIRTYLIRVGNQFDKNGIQIGTSGVLGGNELYWNEIQSRSGYPYPLIEYTTVTNKPRRVFEPDFERLKHTCMVNGVTQLAINFIDYINYEDKSVNKWEDLSETSKKFICKVEKITNVPVTLIGTGERNCDIIDLRNKILN